MPLTGYHRIAGERSARGNECFAAHDPATDASLEPSYVDATSAEIDEAMTAAAAAHPDFETRGREVRARLLEAIADGLEGLGDELIERAHLESGLPAGRLTGERGRTCGQLRKFAAAVREGSFLDLRIDPALPERTPLPRADLRRMGRAIGPVLVFGASNFPLAFSVAGGDTASALAAGCPVVVKGHPAHPGTSELVGEVIAACVAQLELPAGVFSLVHGRAHGVGARLVTDPRTRAVAFTGSYRGGKALFDLATARPEPIPVFAEMGSVNPVFLLPGALAREPATIAAGLSGSVCLGAGQFCTNPGLVVLPHGEGSEAFLTALAEATTGATAQTMLHAGIAEAYRAGQTRLERHPGVETLARSNAEPGANGAVPVTFVTDAEGFTADASLQEEVFGPSTLVIRTAGIEQTLAVARALSGQLTATVHGTADDLEAHASLIPALEARVGRLLFGGYPTGVEVSPAMLHGGPFPATTAPATTSVGTAAVSRFLRPVCYQNAPEAVLPPELRDANPDGLLRLVDGAWSRESL